jgi:hypothetical protein
MVDKKWDLTGVHGLNKFLWSKLQSELEWSFSNYGGLNPIVPASQQPELNDYSGPYVVYNYSHQSPGDDFFIQEEQVAYAVYSSNELDIRRFINLVVEYFKREDESAQMLNDWLHTGNNGSVENKRFDYKYTRIISSFGAQPPISEGGRQDGSVILRIAYTYYDPTTGKERLVI